MKSILQKRNYVNQQVFFSKEGDHGLLRNAFNTFLDTLIRENAEYSTDGCSLFASDLDIEDKKLFLSYLITIEDYEDYISDPLRLKLAIKEYEPEMQALINERLDDIWHEDMQEAGLLLCHHRDNYEPFYRRK